MTDRPESPSCRSERSNNSMDPPYHFKEKKPLDNISVRSMDPPHQFKEVKLLGNKSKKVDRPESPSCGSEMSNSSMEPPHQFTPMKPLDIISFRSGRSNNSMDAPHQFKEVDPTGHKSKETDRRGSSQGKLVKSKSLEFTSEKRHRPKSPSRKSTKSATSQPRSQVTYSTTADSGIGSMGTDWLRDTTIINIPEPRPNPRHAVPGDVACDLCEGRKLKACKSCMTCLASFCERHVIDHYRIEALRRHLLVEVTKNLNILQENAKLKKTMEENRSLKNEITQLKQKIAELKFPEVICRGKTPEAADLMLDPNTAHCTLLLSDDHKRVHLGDKTTVQQSANRFDKSQCVLAREGFSSGRHYWEVEVNKEFTIGVARQSAQRNGKVNFSPKEGYWCIYHFIQSFTALDNPNKRLTADSVPQVLGVCIDVDEKWVTFYNAKTKTHIYTFSHMIFSDGEKLYPMFSTQEKTVDLVIRTAK